MQDIGIAARVNAGGSNCIKAWLCHSTNYTITLNFINLFIIFVLLGKTGLLPQYAGKRVTVVGKVVSQVRTHKLKWKPPPQQYYLCTPALNRIMAKLLCSPPMDKMWQWQWCQVRTMESLWKWLALRVPTDLPAWKKNGRAIWEVTSIWRTMNSWFNFQMESSNTFSSELGQRKYAKLPSS